MLIYYFIERTLAFKGRKYIMAEHSFYVDVYNLAFNTDFGKLILNLNSIILNPLMMLYDHLTKPRLPGFSKNTKIYCKKYF